MKFIDLFAGIGGFHTALHSIGAECVFASEIDTRARETYEVNFKKLSPKLFKNLKFAGDITKVDYSKIPKFDILCAGFPCQPFSICGKKEGFSDTRGNLFFNICEIIKEKQPKVVFLENVKHLLHHDGGNTINVIIKSLEELGYKTNYKVLNAVNFGSPQNRERIIIIASKEKYFDFNDLTYLTKKSQLIDFLDKNGDFEFLEKKEYTLLEKTTTQKHSGLIFKGYRNKNIWKKGIRPNTKHLSRVHRQPNRIYSVLGTHPTIPSQETSGRFFIHHPHNDYVRKLTINECYKIMGFSENFIINNSKAEAYKQIGNSVNIPMITEIAKSIKKQFFTSRETLDDKEKSQRYFVRGIQQQDLFIQETA